jgi:hypothetical protein
MMPVVYLPAWGHPGIPVVRFVYTAPRSTRTFDPPVGTTYTSRTTGLSGRYSRHMSAVSPGVTRLV